MDRSLDGMSAASFGERHGPYGRHVETWSTPELQLCCLDVHTEVASVDWIGCMHSPEQAEILLGAVERTGYDQIRGRQI